MLQGYEIVKNLGYQKYWTLQSRKRSNLISHERHHDLHSADVRFRALSHADHRVSFRVFHPSYETKRGGRLLGVLQQQRKFITVSCTVSKPPSHRTTWTGEIINHDSHRRSGWMRLSLIVILRNFYTFIKNCGVDFSLLNGCFYISAVLLQTWKSYSPFWRTRLQGQKFI